MVQYENDPELLSALLASMNEAKLQSIVVPAEPPGTADPQTVCTIQFKGPTGQKFVRRFYKINTVTDLINSYKLEMKETQTIGLFTAFPKRDLSDGSRNLSELQFGKQETVMVKYL